MPCWALVAESTRPVPPRIPVNAVSPAVGAPRCRSSLHVNAWQDMLTRPSHPSEFPLAPRAGQSAKMSKMVNLGHPVQNASHLLVTSHADRKSTTVSAARPTSTFHLTCCFCRSLHASHWFSFERMNPLIRKDEYFRPISHAGRTGHHTRPRLTRMPQRR